MNRTVTGSDDFVGYTPRECGQHRTVGPSRGPAQVEISRESLEFTPADLYTVLVEALRNPHNHTPSFDQTGPR